MAKATSGPDVAIHPPLVALGAPLLAALLQWVMPVRFLPPAGAPVALVAGLVLIALALAIALWGVATFRRSGTNVDPRHPALRLVETGPFRLTRNPMYVGMVTLQPGLALTFSLDWALILSPAVWAILHFGVVLREEAYLTATFGAPYETFLGRTRRWI